MTVTVNGITVEVSRWPSAEVAAVRELLRQRAIAVGILVPDTDDNDAVSAQVSSGYSPAK
jgi:peptidyl-prolyl cis-trans isomerase C